MENFSTVGVRLVCAALFAGGTAGGAAAATCEFLPNAPDQHAVVKGDTLWGIAGRFLEHPWCWGQVWGLNRDEIRDPHWIYPGQIVYLDRAAGRLRLGGGPGAADGAGDAADARLSPRLRIEALDKDALPAIPPGAIEPFLSQPLIVEADQLATAPRIVATQENHLFLGKGDKAYVRGELEGGSAFQVFRPGKPLKDPLSQAVIGHEAFYLGTMTLRSAAKAEAKANAKAEAGAANDIHTFVIASTKQEMGVGDRLLPAPPVPMRSYAPHTPSRQVDARVMSIYGGVSYAGQNQIVSVNRGALDGLDIGSVLQLYHDGRTVTDATAAKGWFGIGKPQVKLPDEQYGSLFIFRVFKHIAYGLIMQVTEPVQVGDVATNPE
ncbi:LysM peptidoglycan-binding domain-containing protein [Janthinobacterium fluminis]|uniref:LysM domain-containing protein n=1 Tax=Janthinobacterium fluminis TaxID=2987524 RepID=A0ABT5K773_9BURK|nr:LysM domain-containing protein [Janthinobacterium fluminis]MDC8760641.1 LysM domain-containing protein [Janthinobacterium fluminis]